jgi:hypothetical protein
MDTAPLNILTVGGHPITLGTSNTVRLTVDPSGSVGIGTASPSEELHVIGDIITSGYYRVASTQEGGIFDTTGNNGLTVTGSSGSPASTIRAYTGGLERMRIDSSGSVGIGTSSPYSFAKLTVAGTAGVQTGATQQIVINAPTTTAGQGAGIRFNAASGANEAIGVIGVVNEASGNSGAMTFHVYDLGATIPERMRITSAGNVGIGTASPTLDGSLAGLSVNASGTVLHIDDGDGATLKLTDPASGANRGLGITLQGTSAAISNCESGELRFGTGNTERMRIDSSGNVGIGTSSISPYKLRVSESATGGTVFARVENTGTTGSNNTAAFQVGTSSNAFQINCNEQFNYSQLVNIGSAVNLYYDSNSHIFRTNSGTERLQVTSTGKINTSNRDFGFHNHNTTVSLADDASIVINAGTAGGGLLAIYETASGQWANFGVGYNGATLMSALNLVVFDVADTDGKICVFSSGHTITIKNRLGGTKNFYINMFMAGNNFAG